jgi:hypothetical protein
MKQSAQAGFVPMLDQHRLQKSGKVWGSYIEIRMHG